MKYTEGTDKLSSIRRRFEDAVDHTDKAHAESHRASRFYHNSEGEGQWESEDLTYLRENLRPAFSFNIIKSKIDTFHGMYSDAQRSPNVSATKGDDELLADVVNHVVEEILEDAKYERLAARMLKTGTITGECGMHIEVEPSSLGPDWIRVNLYRIMPYELHWDISSLEPDRTDARYVFWDRWLDKDEFGYAYPEHAEKWDFLGKNGDRTDDHGDGSEFFHSEPGQVEDMFTDSDYGDSDRYYRYYYDRRKDKVRVIRYEYLTYKTKYYALNMQTNERAEITEDRKEQVAAAEAMGMPIKLIEAEEEVAEVCEFAGTVMLGEYDEAGPFEGFSIVPYCYDVDEETGTAYGMVRNLFDPQMELNKSKSLEIEHIAQSVATGVTAEKDAISDLNQFSDQRRKGAGVSIVEKNMLVEGRVKENQVTPPNQAVLMRMQSAMQLLDEVSAIPSASNLTAAEHQQSGVTVSIRYHKSRQAVSDPFANFEDSQRTIFRKVVQCVTQSMPDDQIQEFLGTDGKYHVEDGVIYEMAEVPVDPNAMMMPGMPSREQQPQLAPVNQAEFRKVRGMKWRLDMEYTTENSTLRMLQFDVLMQMLDRGIPVDPEVLVDYAINSKSAREKLVAYAEKIEKQNAEAQQAQAEAQSKAMEQQNQMFGQIEAAKIQETTRHNQASEQLDLSDQEIKERLEFLKIWEKADTDEKAQMFDQVKFAVEQERAQMEARNSGTQNQR